jgi:transcriptional regulator with XRE-family HTH domain
VLLRVVYTIALTVGATDPQHLPGFFKQLFDRNRRPRLSRRDFTEATGIDQTQLWRIEHSEVVPSPEECERIAEASGETVEHIEAMAATAADPHAELLRETEAMVERSKDQASAARRMKALAKRISRR